MFQVFKSCMSKKFIFFCCKDHAPFKAFSLLFLFTKRTAYCILSLFFPWLRCVLKNYPTFVNCNNIFLDNLILFIYPESYATSKKLFHLITANEQLVFKTSSCHATFRQIFNFEIFKFSITRKQRKTPNFHSIYE